MVLTVVGLLGTTAAILFIREATFTRDVPVDPGTTIVSSGDVRPFSFVSRQDQVPVVTALLSVPSPSATSAPRTHVSTSGSQEWAAPQLGHAIIDPSSCWSAR